MIKLAVSRDEMASRTRLFSELDKEWILRDAGTWRWCLTLTPINMADKEHYTMIALADATEQDGGAYDEGCIFAGSRSMAALVSG